VVQGGVFAEDLFCLDFWVSNDPTKCIDELPS
jgi:hypothetical protein